MQRTPDLGERPTLAQVAMMPSSDYRRRGLAMGMLWLLSDLGLEVYEEPQHQGELGRAWIGHSDPTFPEHDRWLYATADSKPDQWLGFRQLSCRASDQAAKSYSTIVNPYEELLEVLSNAENALNTLPHPAMHKDLKWLTRYHSVYKSINTRALPLMPVHADWQFLHDLRYHEAEWRAANAEPDLPRDILLRMHGFGKVLDEGIDL